MNIRKLIPLLVCGAVMNCLATEIEPKPTKVEKINGSTVFGLAEITDDYTLRVKTDSGLQNIPLTSLAEKDFLKYGFQKDRSQDGKFWSERKKAVQSSGSKDSVVEVHLAEIAPFQPIIDAYEKKQASQKKAQIPAPKTPPEPFKPLFSRPGSSAIAQPFGGFSQGAQPAVGAGTTVISTTGAGMPASLPALPTAP